MESVEIIKYYKKLQKDFERSGFNVLIDNDYFLVIDKTKSEHGSYHYKTLEELDAFILGYTHEEES